MTLKEKFQQLSDQVFVDPKETVTYPPVALSYGYYKINDDYYPVPIGTYGNFSFIQAPPKSKKTFFVSMLASAYISGSTEYTGDIEGHRGDLNLVHFDTEQGKFHAQKVFKRVLHMAKADNTNYDTYGLRVLSVQRRIEFIEMYLNLHGQDLGFMIIDGVADLVNDVNDIVESNNVVQKIMEWTQNYNIHIACVIHSNHNSEKPTGHLGSFLEKKAESQIQLKVNDNDNKLVKVICKRSRNFPFEEFNFEVDSFSYPRLVDKIDDLLKFNNGNKFNF
ncbi:MAG: hypothetical protein Unbinned8454contig1000_38 [Prokaryotic dsDNA virus sp.]|nr:MAG: hypothetical protein Unbinned8454contig1000_38 [Prokaryotic dsDNA virus sp.]|tara:strand:+ start:1197 stop:2027 length:831 start_codon:yes stop_codon:yes gene_type:complete